MFSSVGFSAASISSSWSSLQCKQCGIPGDMHKNRHFTNSGSRTTSISVPCMVSTIHYPVPKDDLRWLKGKVHLLGRRGLWIKGAAGSYQLPRRRINQGHCTKCIKLLLGLTGCLMLGSGNSSSNKKQNKDKDTPLPQEQTRTFNPRVLLRDCWRIPLSTKCIGRLRRRLSVGICISTRNRQVKDTISKDSLVVFVGLRFTPTRA